MEIKIDLKLPNIPNIADLCPRCLGTGKLKAMQNAINHEGRTVRVEDTKVKCPRCGGKGFLKKQEG